MTFETLTLKNFGPFSGDYSVDLAPKNSKNMILFGGLNGSGKTTILTALRLVLFGKIGAKSTTGGQAYQKVLESYINRNNPVDVTWIELDFRKEISDSNLYRIRRSWCKSGKSIQEDFDYKKIQVDDDGKEAIQNLLVDGMNWYNSVEDIFPPQIADLFLFDGERIEEMADPKHTSKLLESALNALFGGGTLYQLERDLKILERDLLQEQVIITGDAELERRILKLKTLEEQLDGIEKRKESVLAELQELEEIEDKLRENLRVMGGEFYHKREEYEQTLIEAEKRGRKLNEELIGLMNQELPFHLLLNQLPGIISESEGTLSNGDIAVVEDIVYKRDEKLLEVLREKSLAEELIEIIKDTLNSTKLPNRESIIGVFNHEEALESQKILDKSKQTENHFKSIIKVYRKAQDEKNHYKES